MSQSYKDKVVVITGASSGIGEALAREIASRGGSVVLAARRKEKLDAIAASLKSPSLAVACDVTRRSDVQKLFQSAMEKFGRVDVWVNNAGRGLSRSVADLTDEDIDTALRDNLKSALYGMQAVLPHLKQRGTGVIANVSSMLGRVPFATFRSAYSAMKAALNSLTETLRFELRESHPQLRVVTVLPGVVATDFGNNALGGGPDSRQLPNAQDVNEVARVIADGLLSGPVDLYTRQAYAAMPIEFLQKLAAK